MFTFTFVFILNRATLAAQDHVRLKTADVSRLLSMAFVIKYRKRQQPQTSATFGVFSICTGTFSDEETEGSIVVHGTGSGSSRPRPRLG